MNYKKNYTYKFENICCYKFTQESEKVEDEEEDEGIE